jgi:hypothetical protein
MMKKEKIAPKTWKSTTDTKESLLYTWRATAYPVIAGETDTDRGIMLRGDHEGDPAFPTIDEIEASLLDGNLASQLAEFWVIERTDGPAIRVTPRTWAAYPPSLVWPYDPTAGR